MKTMTIEAFRERAFALALEKGCEAAETYFAEGDDFSVNALNGAIEQYAVSRACGMSLRVLLDGKNGYAYTECFDDPEELVLRAMDNARTIETDDAHPMQIKCEYAAVERKESRLSGMDEAEKIALALQLEKDALAADARVLRVQYCEVGTDRSRIAIHNTRGLCAERESRTALAGVVPIMRQGEEMQTAIAFRVGDAALDTAGCALEAVRETAARFGGEPVPSGSYAVVLRYDAMADLLTAFSPVFSAEEAQKGRSMLKDREGTVVAAPCVTIADDPFHPYAPRAFDGEGTPCVRKNVIENGTLTTLLHNLKTAKKAGCESTGNGRRASAASTVGVGPTVMYIVPGADALEILLSDMGDGLLITELQGLHAGLDTVSGDFSLKASGRRIEGGKDVGAVSQITVAGNFLTLLGAVEAVGSDLKFGYPGGACIGAPSVRVRSLMVAGK